MRLRKKSVWGKIDAKGNLDYYKGEIEAFCKLHPNRNVVIRFEVMPNLSSSKTKGYYYGYVLPTITRAFYELGTRYTEQQCDRFLREQCPSIGDTEYRDSDGTLSRRVKMIDDMDSAEASEYLDWLKEYASENLYCIIDDPDI